MHIGAGLAFSSMLCIAITIIMMRFLQNVYHGLINLVFGVWGALQTTLLAVALGVLEYPHDLQDALLMMATGVVFFMGQTFLALALQFEEAGPVSLVRTSEVVFAFIWQFLFLKVSPDIFRY
ncbi:hypothetical protein Ocin01_04506 [Orchesella cincta]|uniref:EamA domain-containing protein n=1 Tax=Orchesella cincta TaxID=48709 RepID=A0A1D2NA87_ORCCI|nr:hypothetical protein Ocin01_04506 [Orchesella cincta]